MHQFAEPRLNLGYTSRRLKTDELEKQRRAIVARAQEHTPVPRAPIEHQPATCARWRGSIGREPVLSGSKQHLALTDAHAVKRSALRGGLRSASVLADAAVNTHSLTDSRRRSSSADSRGRTSRRSSRSSYCVPPTELPTDIETMDKYLRDAPNNTHQASLICRMHQVRCPPSDRRGRVQRHRRGAPRVPSACTPPRYQAIATAIETHSRPTS